MAKKDLVSDLVTAILLNLFAYKFRVKKAFLPCPSCKTVYKGLACTENFRMHTKNTWNPLRFSRIHRDSAYLGRDCKKFSQDSE